MIREREGEEGTYGRQKEHRGGERRVAHNTVPVGSQYNNQQIFKSDKGVIILLYVSHYFYPIWSQAAFEFVKPASSL